MKNKLKSVRRGSKPAAASQPKTNARKATAPLTHQRAAIITCVLILRDGSEFARVDFPTDVFACIEQVASKEGITLAQLFMKALRHQLASQKIRRAA
jgi:hypothetical protein